ncbi:MAG: hypothetical protein RIQ52_1431 [Pseudomonadota bacterium]|jgi:acetyltransferase
MTTPHLSALIQPQVIAVFGASPRPDSVAGQVYRNLRAAGFHGQLYPVNPKRDTLDGLPCYPDLSALPQPAELVVIATPAATVPAIIRHCGEQGVPAAIVLSAGFSAQDPDGPELKAEMLAAARHAGIRLLGPNCLGLMRPSLGMNATFSLNQGHTGSLALISQSGAICTAILDWADTHGIGFSLMASIGEASDIGFAELLDFLVEDEETRSILLYIEGIREAAPFLHSLRKAARRKPVIVIKSGRFAEGSRAAMTHTGALVGADGVFDAALRRAGVVRATTIAQLFAAAQLLSGPHRVQGERIAIVTNAGGPGVMATDAIIERGLKLAELAPATLASLDGQLPGFWSHANPVDILGDAPPQRYAAAVSACLADPGVDGLLVMLTPQAMSAPTAAAQAVVEAARSSDKPVLSCWLGASQVAEARHVFEAAHLPTFPNPESAIDAFSFLAQYQRNQSLLAASPEAFTPTAVCAEGMAIVAAAQAESRHLLSAEETRALLALFDFPLLPMAVATSAEAAQQAAAAMGYPVVLKIRSPDITHKSDVDGIRLHLADADAVAEAYHAIQASARQHRPDARLAGVTVEKMYNGHHGRELLLGVSQDPVFGHVISFGAGGVSVEVTRDQALTLPPLDRTLALQLISQTRISRLLPAYRNVPAAAVDTLVDALISVSRLVCAVPAIQEMDINPLLLDAEGAYALDARIIVSAGAAQDAPAH